MKNVKEYLQALKSIKGHFTELKAIEKKSDSTINNIAIKHRDLIHALETKMYNEQQAVKDTTKVTIDQMNVEIAPYLELREQFKRTMDFFLLIQENPSQDSPTFKKPVVKVYIYGEKTIYEPIDIIADDKYKFIAAYIIDDKNKTVNKYQLIIIGNTIFNNKVMEIKMDYGIGDASDNTALRVNIKNDKTKEALQKWYEKKVKGKRTSEILEDFLTAQKEYQEAKELYKQKDWQIAFLNHRKYYYENHYSRGTETPEYKEIIKQLNALEKK